MNSTAQWNGVHGIADYGLWFILSSLPVQTRVVQNHYGPCCKLMFLVFSDFSVFTHVLVLVGDASDCKLQNLLRIGLTPDVSRVCPGPECIGPEVASFGCVAV